MASLSASYTFDTGESVGVSIEIENDYPDALDQGIKVAGSLIREVLVSVAVCAEVDDADEEP